MRVTDLKLTNVRSIKTAQLHFQPGFNLVIGENGVGKTTSLDALAECLGEFVRLANRLRGRVGTMGIEAIRVGSPALDIECGFEDAGKQYRYVIHRPRESSALHAEKVGTRAQTQETPEKRGFIGEWPPSIPVGDAGNRPLGVLFATNRAVTSERWRVKPSGGRSRAFELALSEREVQLGYFANWMRAKEVVANERSRQVLAAVEKAVRDFVPGYGNLRVGDTDGGALLLDRDEAALAIRQLSHGERGIIALVLDLTRRLAEANPGLRNPSEEASAVVLIDEIDLHLHPKWQRQIVRKLSETFPRCQFIATTHSPQVIGEVARERIQIITDRGAYSPTHSFGVDSNRVLEEIMGATPRAELVEELLARIREEIDEDEFEQVRRSLNQLIDRVGSDDPEVTRIRAFVEFMEESE